MRRQSHRYRGSALARDPQSVQTACLPLLTLTQAVYQQAMYDLGAIPPEAAGILLGPQNAEPLATHWALDASGSSTGVSFTLDVAALNDVLRQYRQCELTCVGLIHSHPRGIVTPSLGDVAYLEDLFMRPTNETLDRFLFPIYCDGRLYPYIVWRRKAGLAVTPAALLLL